jgi:hypothetical protein
VAQGRRRARNSTKSPGFVKGTRAERKENEQNDTKQEGWEKYLMYHLVSAVISAQYQVSTSSLQLLVPSDNHDVEIARLRYVPT